MANVLYPGCCCPSIFQWKTCQCYDSNIESYDMADGTYRKRAVTYPGASDLDPQPIPPPARSRAQTESNIRHPMARKKKYPGANDRRRSLSDPQTGVSKFLHWGLGYFATLANLTRNTPLIQSERGTHDNIPPKTIAPISTHVLAAYSGPDGGLANILVDRDSNKVYDASEWKIRQLGRAATPPEEGDSNDSTNQSLQVSASNNSSNTNHDRRDEAARIRDWDLRKHWAYGIAVSLYECKNDDTKECTGDPIADVVAIRSTENSAILGLADGCGWGYGPRRAARCAMKGCMDYIAERLYSNTRQGDDVTNTTQIFKIMRDSIDEGQRLVIASTATLTTLVLCVVTQIAKSKDFVVCTMNIGDSLAYVFSEAHGVRELTEDSRDYTSHRNIRFCDGALGPALGESPDLTNLTYSLSVVQKGDVVFLTSDGVSDNFDPVIAGKAKASSEYDNEGGVTPVPIGETDPKLVSYSPQERQNETECQFNNILRQNNIPNENLNDAQAVCSKLLAFTSELTQEKRRAQQSINSVLTDRGKIKDNETPSDLPAHDLTPEGMRKYVRSLPGKLDHASVVAYVVGRHGIEEVDEEEVNVETEDVFESKEEVEQMEKELKRDEKLNPEGCTGDNTN